MLLPNTEKRHSPIAPQLDALCALFDEELERQQNILSLCRAQGDAARAHDLEALEARTAAITTLLEDGLHAEKKRLGLLEGIVAYYALPIERQTLSHLIAVAPEPWRTRMLDFQRQIKAVLAGTREVVKSNAGYMRRSLRIVNHSVHLFTGQAADTEYCPTSRRATTAHQRPVLVNAQG